MTETQPPGGATVGESPARPPCAAQTKQGGQCRAWALPGTTLCQVHEPSRQAHVRELRSRGGTVTALRSRRRRLHTVGALVRYGGERLLDMEEGVIGLDLARGLFYALAVQAKLVELAQTADLDKRLGAIEECLAAQQQPAPRTSRWLA